MRVHFWGTRGSIAVALTHRDLQRKLAQLVGVAKPPDSAPPPLTYGGHTSCVEIVGGSEIMICDMGTGARPLGQDLMRRSAGTAPTVNVFMSHVHWDHLLGFPFFAPAYCSGARIRIHGCHAALEPAFRTQHSMPFFPVDFARLDASVEFVQLQPGHWYEIAGMRVQPKLQHHSGDSYGYRFERDGKSLVYSTDSEHKLDDSAQSAAFVEFFRDADLVVFDAMYSLLDAVTIKEDWGHSSNVVGVELAQLARVKHLCLFHHDPACDDDQIDSILKDAIRLEELTRGAHTVKVSAAWDGLEIEV
jgi:phosphoribosyl 1,2-cyclic phosphodiesterase